jgi:hypothetical protein
MTKKALINSTLKTLRAYQEKMLQKIENLENAVGQGRAWNARATRIELGKIIEEMIVHVVGDLAEGASTGKGKTNAKDKGTT